MSGDQEAGDGPVDEGRPRPVLADKLNLLLEVMHPSDRGPFTFKEVQAGIEANGAKLSRARWFYLREGKDTNDRRLLKAIALFFGVDPSYLLDDDVTTDSRVDAQLQLLQTLRDSEVRNTALRAVEELPPEALTEIAELIRQRLQDKPPG